MAGAPLGNQNAKKGKEFGERLRKLCVQEDWKRVQTAAEELLNNAAAGEPWALQMLAERLDGKVPQGVIGGDEDDNPIQTLVKVAFVGANTGGV